MKAEHGAGLKKAHEDCVPCCMTCIGCLWIKRKASLKTGFFHKPSGVLLEEYDSCMNDLEEYRKTLGRLMFDPVEDEVVWIEIDAKGAKTPLLFTLSRLIQAKFWPTGFHREKALSSHRGRLSSRTL
ncbi:hypothetical protein PO124_15815 [Bacillus licheniformis]|nr:hypothetical protein [Bacillus licheniformis]